jgi:branched-chain amino acid transport system substrate-binding protein
MPFARTMALTVAAAIVGGGVPATVGADESLIIGLVASMTGKEAAFGISNEKGIRLAIDEQNQKGGIRGRTIVLRTIDDQGEPDEAADAARRLILEGKAVTLLGEVASSRSMAMARVADAQQVPMVSPMSTNPKVTRDGARVRPYVFRVCFIDPFQGTVMAKFARENLDLTKVAILRDLANEYSIGLADFFTTSFKKRGGVIVADLSYRAGDQDFRPQLNAIKVKKPDAIYIPGYYPDAALIGRQARELGLSPLFMGGDGWDSDKLPILAQGVLDGSFFTTHFTSEDPSPQIQEYVKKFRAAYGTIPDAPAVLGYDAARVVMAAMETARDFTGPSIRDALESIHDFQAVSGVITLDSEHNAVKPAVVIGVRDNTPHYTATIRP